MKVAKDLKKNFKERNGITLIALVITIIVLLILAGISIMMLAGDNSILKRGIEAKEQTETKSDLEMVKLAVTSGITENMVGQTKINEAIEDYLKTEDSSVTVTGSSDEKTITFKGKIYNVNVKTGSVTAFTQEELEERKAIKLLVNSGEDGLVGLPIENTTLCKIDWGDGTIEDHTPPSKTDLGEINTFRVASLDNIRLAMHKPDSYTHQYNEENKEYTVTIEGDVDNIHTNQIGITKNKIIEVLQWGETGLVSISLKNCENLRKIANPTENSFKNIRWFTSTFYGCTRLTSIPESLFANCPNVTSFELTFGKCTGLTSIPEGLFSNCLNVTNFRSTFSGCTGLTGNAPKLWERTNVKSFDKCFYDCEQLDNYEEIPNAWKGVIAL